MSNEEKKSKVLKEQYVPTAEFYSQIIDSLQDYSIFTVDKDLNVNSWNSGATNIFQYETDEIVGKPFETIFTEKDIEDGIPAKEISTALELGRSVDVRWHLCKDGTTFYADGLVFPLKSVDEQVIGYVKILRDITARKASEDAIKKYAKDLEDINSHKESVLAILSHDLRSPLAGIIQGAEFLKLNFDVIDATLAKDLLDEFHKAAITELDMLDYLVEWARVKYAADTYTPVRIELDKAVTRVFKNLKETAASSTINLHSEIDRNTIVFADEKMLLSIIQNLISNAIKFSHKGGFVTVSARKSKGEIIVEVNDNGSGMSPEIKDSLFSPQIKSLLKAVEKNSGAGIGLLLVKGFLEKNGGKIWVESFAGKGSSFYFTLPIVESVNEIEGVAMQEI